MSTDFKVTAKLVIVPNADGVSGDGYFYAGATIPAAWNPERCEQLVKDGMLEHAGKADPEPSASASSDGKPAKVNDILAEVGTDKEKAAAALETEKARGDDARSTLLEKLQAVLDAD